MKRLAWILLFCLALAGCQLPVTQDKPEQLVELGKPFALPLGERVRLYGSTLDVTFTSLLTDDRCPMNIQCAATEPVEVEIKIGRTGSVIGELLQLSAHTDTTGEVVPTAPDAVISATYGSYRIDLLAVTPYPDAQRKSAASHYQVTLLITAGDGPPLPDKQNATGLPEATSTAGLGAEVELGRGEAVVLPDEQLWLRFNEAIVDSRCPSNVSCVWSGIVNVQLSAMRANQEAETFVVGGATNGYGVVTGAIVEASGPTEWWYKGYVIELKQVLPYPARTDRATKPDAYRVTVVITKSEENPPQEPTVTPSSTEIPFPSDESGLPIFCVSELAVTRLAAGESTAPPSGITPLVAALTLADEETANRLCVALFGEDWHIAQQYNLNGSWDKYLPDVAAYWVWDSQNQKPVQAP